MTLRKLEIIIEDISKTITVRVLQEYKKLPLKTLWTSYQQGKEQSAYKNGKEEIH